MDDVKSFRQPGSSTPGHPEYGLTTGVEATTGPLGQGVSMSVGMAIAEKWLAAPLQQPDATLIDYNIYALCSDGEMMEGVASEAASLAGHLKLDNLCWIYDSNESHARRAVLLGLQRRRSRPASSPMAGMS